MNETGSWVVDTCVLLDILLGDPKFASASEACLVETANKGLVVSPVTVVELAAALPDLRELHSFLSDYDISAHEVWGRDETAMAHAAWSLALGRRRQTKAPRRPIADVFIGAFAQRRGGLITRNPDDFRTLFPTLRQRVP